MGEGEKSLYYILTEQRLPADFDWQSLIYQMIDECHRYMSADAFKGALELAVYTRQPPDVTLFGAWVSQVHENDYLSMEPATLKLFAENCDRLFEGRPFHFDDCFMMWSAFSADSPREYLVNCATFNWRECALVREEVETMHAAGLLTDEERLEWIEHSYWSPIYCGDYDAGLVSARVVADGMEIFTNHPGSSTYSAHELYPVSLESARIVYDRLNAIEDQRERLPVIAEFRKRNADICKIIDDVAYPSN